MNIKIFTLDSSRWTCSNKDCKHSSEYHYNIIGDIWRMKAGFPCAEISIRGNSELYCYECIDFIYLKVKKSLDKKVWVLK